jgi:hypothetical protein
VLKEINLIVNAAPLPLDQAYEHLTSPNKQRKVIIAQRESIDPTLIKDSQALGKTLFGQQGPGSEDALFSYLQQDVRSWNDDLVGFQPLASTDKYPGLSEIKSAIAALQRFTQESDSLRFLKRFVATKDELLDLAEDVQELRDFYTTQKHSWEELRAGVETLALNRLQLESDGEAGPALTRMEEILGTERPYKLLHEVEPLLHTARTVNDKLISAARGPAVTEIQRLFDMVTAELDRVSADDTLRRTATDKLNQLRETAAEAISIAHIAEATRAAESAYEHAMTAIEQRPTKPDNPKPDPVKKRHVVEVRTLAEGFIETPEQLDDFLEKLRARVKAAIEAGERVQIR